VFSSRANHKLLKSGAEASASVASGAFDEVLPQIYSELRILAAAVLHHERRAQTLQVTALVHEAYLTMSKQRNLVFGTAESFLAAASVTIRRIMVDRARQRNALRHGFGWQRVGFNDSAEIPAVPQPDLLGLHDAMIQLEAKHPRAARVVEHRYFGGMTVSEIAAALKVSTTTIDEDWAFAKAWLHRALRDPEAIAPRPMGRGE